MSRSPIAGAALTGVLVALSVTACGSDAGDEFASQSVEKITAQSEADMKALHSVTLDGTVTQNDERLDIKLSADTDGTCSGTIGVGGGSADILGVGKDQYIKGDEKFWSASTGGSADQVMALLGDKWAKLPSGSGSFDEFCDLDKLFESLGDSSHDEKLTKGKVIEIDGKHAVEIITKEDDGGTTRAWVATEGKHYILKIENKGGKEPGSMALSHFNEPVDAKAPAKDEYVDLGALG